MLTHSYSHLIASSSKRVAGAILHLALHCQPQPNEHDYARSYRRVAGTVPVITEFGCSVHTGQQPGALVNFDNMNLSCWKYCALESYFGPSASQQHRVSNLM